MKRLKERNFSISYWLTIFYFVVKEDITKKLRYFQNLGYLIIFLVIYALVITVVEEHYHIIGKNADINQLLIVFNFVIGLLLVFRLNAAYGRWWDARGQWGSLVNNSRNLAIKFDNYIGLNSDPLFRECLAHFPTLLKFHLRKEFDCSKKLVLDIGLDSKDDHHHPNLILHTMSRILNDYRKKGTISFEQYLSIEVHLSNLTDILGACEKIRNTPIPAGFGFFIKLALFVYILIFPFDWVDNFGYFILPVLIIIIYTLLGVEILAEEVEEPFGYDSNDLKLDGISANIYNNVMSIANLTVSDEQN
ncbi:hypothetical protein OAO18_07480 [Francisellaceae bacterium]|nr:hypothetical protein [Francisellaceae bacterium]